MLGPAEGEVNRPEVPEWMGRPERSNWLALRTITWIALSLGRPLARLMLYPICLYFIAFSVKPRAASRHYLGKVLGRKAGLADAFRHYHTFAATILDRLFLLREQLWRFDIRVEGADACCWARTSAASRSYAPPGARADSRSAW
jgi:predicted LPLAT superfamily acyltransferase